MRRMRNAENAESGVRSEEDRMRKTGLAREGAAAWRSYRSKGRSIRSASL